MSKTQQKPKYVYKCHGCGVRLKGRRFCVDCEPETRMGRWHDTAVDMYKKDPRPLSIAVKMGINAKDVIALLKARGVMEHSRYKEFEFYVRGDGD